MSASRRGFVMTSRRRSVTLAAAETTTTFSPALDRITSTMARMDSGSAIAAPPNFITRIGSPQVAEGVRELRVQERSPGAAADRVVDEEEEAEDVVVRAEAAHGDRHAPGARRRPRVHVEEGLRSVRLRPHQNRRRRRRGER